MPWDAGEDGKRGQQALRPPEPVAQGHPKRGAPICFRGVC